MVRQAQLSWDDEHPCPAELEHRKWDLEENAVDDHFDHSQKLLTGARGDLRRKKQIRNQTPKPK